ncbi:MAG: anti-sigma factor antagonist [Chloroflexota bacterium]|nr:MAG: anti-sigma factor antagonist [Chloroflexota bacterium]
MSTQILEATVRRQEKAAIIDLSGIIDAFAEAALNTAYTQAESQNTEVILLNFSQVAYINSTGIALIVGLLAKARKTHKRLLTCGLSSHYTEIFQITRLADFMGIYSDEESALREAN